MIASNTIFDLPSTVHFISSIIDDCLNQKSVMVVIPPQIEVFEVECMIRQKINDYGLLVGEVILTDLPTDQPPAALLGERFSVDWVNENCPMTVANLLASPGLPECIFLESFSMLDHTKKTRWIEFINSWNKVPLTGGKYGIQQKPAICLVLSGTDLTVGAFSREPQLSIRYWFGFPSALELRVLCRFSSEHSIKNVKEPWREHLIPSLAENDVSLAEQLWEKIFLPIDELMGCFAEDAVNKGWTKELLEQWGIKKFFTNQNSENDLNKINSYYPDLLIHGVLCHTPEYGTEIHASALAALGECEQIKKRIWRGQLPLLLPLVDTVRLFLCEQLTREHGAGWPLFFPPKEPEELEQVKNSPQACEFGHIKYTILNHMQFREERKYLRMLQIARKIRNKLAHYQPVDFIEYQNLIREAGKFGVRI